jgi:hypothetical protein
MQYDPGSSSILFNCDKLGFDEALSTPIEIYLNAPMANLLNAFCMINKGFNVSNGKNYKLVVKNYDNGNVIEYTDYDAIQLYEEYSSVGSWNPIKAIVFTSSSLPVEGTISAAPKTFGGISNLANYAPNLTTNIITDFTVNLLTGKEYLPSVDYVAGGTYRLVDMQGNQQQNNLEISIFWSDIYNNLHRFKLPSGGYGSIKIMFRKKTLGI